MGDAVKHGEHGIVFAEDAANGSCGVNVQRLQFAQKQKSEDVVDVGVGEDCACDRRLANAVLWLEFGSGFDLIA